MKRALMTVYAGIALLALVSVISGCSSSRQAERAEPPKEISVRFPATEPPNVNLQAEEPRQTPGEPSVLTDDTKRPWLKVIEVDVAPKEPEHPAEPAAPPK